jgi:hypothetical protein
MPEGFDLNIAEPSGLLADLLAVAGIETSELAPLRNGHWRQVRKLVDCADKMTGLLRQYWSQNRDLAVHFNVEQGKLTCRISCPVSGEEVWDSVASHGDGLRWFLSFLVTLHRFQQKLPDNPLFLLDEPAANLHPTAQRDIRKMLNSLAGVGQVIYATHSPFMLDWSRPHQLRLFERVFADPRQGSATIRNNPYHGRASLGLWEPFRASLGILLGDLGLLDEKNLVLEGPSDQFLFAGLSQVASAPSEVESGASDWSTLPAGDDAAVQALVDLARAHSRAVFVFLDGDDRGRGVKRRLLAERQCDLVLHTGEILPVGTERAATDIEDLFDPAWYVERVNECYGDRLSSPLEVSELDLDNLGTGKAVAEALALRGVDFSKVLVARRIVDRIETEEEIPPGFWRNLFARFKNPLGLALLGANQVCQRMHFHVRVRAAGSLEHLRVQALDEEGVVQVEWKIPPDSDPGDGDPGDGVELIDTIEWRLATDLRHLRRGDWIEFKLVVPLNEYVQQATKLCVRLVYEGGFEDGLEVVLPAPVPRQPPRREDPVAEYLKQHPVGSIVDGVVVRTGPFGFVVQLAPGVTTWNDIREITYGWVSSIEDYVWPGKVVKCKIIPPYRWSGRKFDVSMRQAADTV